MFINYKNIIFFHLRSNCLFLVSGDKNNFLGVVAPTIHVIKLKLDNMNGLKLCTELKDGISNQIVKRFPKVFNFDIEDPTTRNYILSAISHPKFKLSWIPANKIDICRNLLLRECEKTIVHESNENFLEEEPSSKNEIDFFSLLRKNKPSQTAKSIEIKVLSFLEETSDNIDILHTNPEVKNVFKRFNTTLPSSAPVERLFSKAIQIFTPRRNRLSDDMFQNLLFLRENNSLL